jgi:adenylate cyclase
MNPKIFFGELKRRNVYKVAVAYAVVSWLLIQAASIFFPAFNAPQWAMQIVIIILVVGFPIALAFSWAFEITPEGIVRESEVESDRSITHHTGRKIVAITIVLAAIATALFVFQFLRARSTSTSRTSEAPISHKSIAVLPFDNLSRDPDNAYFADGIQEEIMTRLSKIADLKVISRTSTQRYKSAPTNLPEISRQLRVAHILEGTVQKSGDQVRVNVQLINAQTDSHLWADEYDRKITDLFAVESEIASKITSALRAKLTAAEQASIIVKPTSNSEAHELYLRARYFWGKQTGPDLEKAIGYFNDAIARDPNYAVAYAGLSDCYRVLFFWSANPTAAEKANNMEKARVAAEKALAIDGTLGEAHESLASILFLTSFDIAGAKREFERALELNPNDATTHAWFAYTVLPAVGDIERAVAEIKRAIELDPFSANLNASLGYLLIMSRRYPEAIAQCRKAIELESNYYLSHQNLAQALELSGRYDEAIAEYEKLHDPSHDPYVLAFRAHIYGIKGDRTKASELLNQMKELARDRDVWPFGFALAYLGLGDKTQAINWLERAYEQKEYDVIGLLRLHPMLDPLRGDPRFEALVQKVFALTSYGQLKLMPYWDALRGDPRFEKIVDSLAPKETKP